VSFEIELPGYFGLDFSKELEVTLLSCGTTVSCQILNGKMFSNEPSSIWLRPDREITRGALDGPVSSIVFVVPNFPDFLAHGVIREFPGGWTREDEIRLQFFEWNVTIQKTIDFDDSKALLAEKGTFAVNAVGVFERIDGRAFTWHEAAPHLEALRVFLSFACGRWTGPMVPAGVGPNGERVWFRWSVPLIDDGFAVFTWFDIHHGTALTDIAPEFMAKWHDPLWNKAFSYAIYWFVRANLAVAGSDGSLILSQAALEMLSWTYLVRSSGISRTQFKALHTEGAIRELLKALGIPSGVPASLSSLQAFATSGVSTGPTDGVGAVVAVRNNLVHPEKTPGALPVTEAWMLAQRFVELVLLRLCGFNGDHANRTVSPRWVGQVERVPWA
jgi:hypothetical protein